MFLRQPPSATPALYGQDGLGRAAIVHAHYFIGGCDWFITEYDRAQRLAFGWACLGDRANAELGYVNFDELASLRVGPLGWQVEHDTGWCPVTLRQAIADLDQRSGCRKAGR